MLKSLSGMRTSLKLLAGIIMAIMLALAVGGVVFLKRASSTAVPEPILKIDYCGADLEELCVLSFGRDVEENMVVNLFVPDRKFPEFYLKIKRAAIESVYECEKDKEVPTSVYCSGESIGLQEKMEINLISKEDDHLLAAGKLALLAVLLSPDGQSFETQSVNDNSDVFSTEGTQTTIPPAEIDTPTVTPTLITYPDSSYP
jgi:hypothetical protein